MGKYQLLLDSGEIQTKQQQELSLEQIKISDIEAIASIANNQFLIVGSHKGRSSIWI